MKILLLSNKVPYPANDGSSIAMASMIDGLLKNGVELSLLSLNTSKHFKKEEDVTKSLPPQLNFEQVYTDNRITPLGAVLNLLSGKPYHVSRFRVKEFAEKLKSVLTKENFDVIQIEGLSMAVYLPDIKKLTQAKVVLRAHNVEGQIWERHAGSEKRYFRKAYLKLQVKRLSVFEREMLKHIDALVAITAEDLENFLKIQPDLSAISIPCGIDLSRYPACDKDDHQTDLVYLASFDWLPNLQGLYWFMEKVWPLLQNKFPDIRFHFGGRHMPAELKNLRLKGVQVHPDVPDMRKFMCRGRIAVVPLLAGSGMRIKVLENMALGLCQVSTSIGAEGILARDGHELVIADAPAAMAEAILRLLQDEDQIKSIGSRARQGVEKHYDNHKLGRKLLDFYQQAWA